MASNFAGVSTADDSRNDIVVRGNSPTGLLWRLEGIPIPSPNHFATLGTTGSPVSALNPNLLANSDFITSAFPAEYGNAIGGVFDLGLRKGNNKEYEYSVGVAAFPGAELMAEGPLGKKGGSFLVARPLRNSWSIRIGWNNCTNQITMIFHLMLILGKASLGIFRFLEFSEIQTLT